MLPTRPNWNMGRAQLKDALLAAPGQLELVPIHSFGQLSCVTDENKHVIITDDYAKCTSAITTAKPEQCICRESH